MTNTLKGTALLSLLILVGAGCAPTASVEKTDTPDAMVTDTQSGDTGDTMLRDDATNNDALNDDSMVGGDALKDGDGAMVKEDGDAMKGESTVKGSYEAYAPEKLARAEAGDVVLFFHASWCPSCRTLDTDINAHLSDIPDAVTILKTDYDTQTELKKKYGVTYQHTMVQVDKDGNLIKKWNGGSTLAGELGQIQ